MKSQDYRAFVEQLGDLTVTQRDGLLAALKSEGSAAQVICGRTFNALTGTPLAQLHCRTKWLDYARAMVDGVSLRTAAERCNIDLTTSFRWRHRFLKSPKAMKETTVTGIV